MNKQSSEKELIEIIELLNDMYKKYLQNIQENNIELKEDTKYNSFMTSYNENIENKIKKILKKEISRMVSYMYFYFEEEFNQFFIENKLNNYNEETQHMISMIEDNLREYERDGKIQCLNCNKYNNEY